MEGREISGALKLPRELVRKDNTVWVMQEGALAIREVEILFQDTDFAYIGAGLAAGETVVTTNLATVKEGLRLRLRGGGGTAANALSGALSAQP
jgi:multidrug efflux pump subunit AcrA (membrane-fusion protein)